MQTMAKIPKTFETKKINMETLPEYLKITRESFSYDVKHVAKITNVSEKFLVALEEGYYHRLPADVYVYGFLRRLAELYRTDQDLLIAQYKKERGIHENINKTNARPLYKIDSAIKGKIAITPKTITFSLFVLFAAALFGYIIYEAHLGNTPPAIVVVSPADGSVIKDNSVFIHGHTDAGANLTLDGQPVAVDSSGNFNQPISVSEGSKVLTLIAVNNFGKQSSKQISIVGDLPQPSSGNSAAGQTQTFTFTVIVQPKPTIISVQVDDGQAQNINFASGDTKTFTAQNKVVISTADAGSTFVKINDGQQIKLGKDGQSLSNIIFTASSANNSTPAAK